MHQYFCKIRKTEISVQSLSVVSVSPGFGLISEHNKNYLPSLPSLQSLSRLFVFWSSRSSYIQQGFLILTNILMVCPRGCCRGRHLRHCVAVAIATAGVAVAIAATSVEVAIAAAGAEVAIVAAGLAVAIAAAGVVAVAIVAAVVVVAIAATAVAVAIVDQADR